MMISFREKFGCVSSGRGGGSSILEIFAKCLFKVLAFSSGCMSYESLFFKGGGGFCLFFRLEISFAILYHCLIGVFRSARFD